ncbi:MAG: homoserine O-acetyltransferase, partial [bacterium]
YGAAFPPVSIGDMVNGHRLLLKQLGIDRLAAVVGGSMGGMQVLEWIIRHPEMIDNCICIASAARLSAQALAFDLIGRKAITDDPQWAGGDFYASSDLPTRGLALARQIGHITYLSQEMMEEKFGRERTEAGSRFQVESYLEHQGAKFVKRFDANSYVRITAAIDQYDISEKTGSLEKAFAPVLAKVLVVALSSDWLFPPEQSIELATALLRAGKHVTYCELNAPHGHDAFLVDVGHLGEVIRAFLPWVKSIPAHEEESSRRKAANIEHAAPDTRPLNERRKDHEIIADMIKDRARVLDLGCGKGELLRLLAQRRRISGIGVDIDVEHVISVIDSGLDIFQGDIDHGLQIIPDDAYDYAVLSETLQVVRKPKLVLHEMLRIAREGIVSFPNFGTWSHRLSLLFCGRMPKGGALPFEWYETPNIHLFTLDDFVRLCHEDHIRILETVCIPESKVSRILLRLGLRNLGADRILVRIMREDS